MKKIFYKTATNLRFGLLALMLLCCLSNLNAQHRLAITGTITKTQTDSLVPNHLIIFASDTTESEQVVFDTVFTNAKGYYVYKTNVEYIPAGLYYWTTVCGKGMWHYVAVNYVDTIKFSDDSNQSDTIVSDYYLRQNISFCPDIVINPDPPKNVIVKGAIINKNTNTGVSNYLVYIRTDSTNGNTARYDSVYTQCGGSYYYETVVKSHPASFYISTLGCDSIISERITTSEDTLSPQIFYVCVDSMKSITVSGRIMNLTTNSGASFQIVQISSDSNINSECSFNAYVYTDSQGYYNLNVPFSNPSVTYKVSVNACNVSFSRSHTSTGGNIISDFNICNNSNESIDLKGKVLIDGNSADHYKVELIGFVDSLYTVFNGDLRDSGKYSFNNLPIGQYIIRASLDRDSSYFDNFVPTYYGDVTIWTDAIIVDTSINDNDLIINMVEVAAVDTGGNRINGNVFGNGNLVNTTHNGLNISTVFAFEKAFITLSNSADKVITSEPVEANGTYSFNQLADGKYRIRLEHAKINSETLDLTLSGNGSNISVDFTSNGTGSVVTSSKTTVIQKGLLQVYPNPVNDELEINIKNNSLIKNVEIYNSLGQRLYHADFLSAQNGLKLNTTQLSNGMYLLIVRTDKGEIISTKIVK